jgi:glucokinase
MFEFPVLVGDIGGTNARLAILEEGAREPRPLARAATHDHPDPVSAIRKAIADGGGAKPRSALLAVAARVDSARVRMTNANWTIDGEAIGTALGLASVVVVNDYVPVAAAVTRYGAGDLVRLGPACQPGAGARVVMGPGTGFGAAALVPFGERLAIVSTEVGHTEFGPSDVEEFEVWPRIEQAEGRWTVETLLSGPGLARLYAALGNGAQVEPNVVVEGALSGADPVAVRAVDLFGKLLGRSAGDLALSFGATGGVFVAGGIAPRIVPLLERGRFRAAFERKAPHADVVEVIPTAVVTARDPAFVGLAALATEPGRFAYEGQVWGRRARPPH